MGNVYSITLCDRDLHHVPDDIYKHHKHVAKLLLRRNNIQEIPPEIKVLSNLVELSLRDNLLTTVPIEITNLRLLQKLSLANNRLQEPPEPIAAFSQLTWLSLASNITIPDCIFEMRSLTILLLQKNRITTISPRIARCTQLVSLNLSYNRIQHLPVEMKECRNLQHLLLSVNSIGSLSAAVCESWTNLLNLDLHTNELRHLPEQLGCLKSLRRLNLAINKIEEIPASIGQLQLLEWLNLNDNKLTTLPSTMDQMQKLVKMGIVQNKLQTLPAALARLSMLYKLDCRRNEIQYLPSAFKEMQGIHSLLLEENPLCFRYGISNYTREPVSLLELAARAVLDRYCPQDTESSKGIACSGSSSTIHPPNTNGSTSDSTGIGLTNLIPMMAELGLGKASSTASSAHHTPATTPQKNRYSFFSRACATVHPSLSPSSKPTRSSTFTSAHLSDSSSSSSTSPPASSSSPTRPTLPSSSTYSSSTLQPSSLSHTQQQQQQAQPSAPKRSMSRRHSHITKLESLLDPETSLLPIPLIDLLTAPTTACDYCGRRMCTSGWVDFLEPAKLGNSSRMIIPVRHRMCSLKCVRQQHRDSFGGELTESFESTDFHIGPNGEMVGSRPIVPGELDEYMIEAVQEAAEAAGISITHLLEQHHQQQLLEQQQQQQQLLQQPQQQQNQERPLGGGAGHDEQSQLFPELPGRSDPAATMGILSMTALNQMNLNSDLQNPYAYLASSSSASSILGPASVLRQTTARLRRSLSRPITPIEIQVDAQGQLRRVVYRQNNNQGSRSGTSHRRRLIETFRSLSQVGQGGGLGGGGGGHGATNGVVGMGGLGVLAAAGLANHPGANANNNGGGGGGGGGNNAVDAGAGPVRGGSNRAAGEVMNVTTFAVELERF
ncbi:hypothetical protein BGZ70_001480 [Mortierella alpina]|uniref:Disease resistance R13L4/SHOC-2-like LRR domain-containing protein n=1 Tax=Mortierella alpina TaxID=64518 RepID=A0A9P6IVW0_MORAP|nr:hypothetical protein BGZ70_001480 [Mortierella alpina]